MIKVVRQSRTQLVTRAPSWTEQLAAAVIAQAVADANNPLLPATHRLGAAAFLLNRGEMLQFWCSVAGIDPDAIRRYAAKLIVAYGGSPHGRTELVETRRQATLPPPVSTAAERQFVAHEGPPL